MWKVLLDGEGRPEKAVAWLDHPEVTAWALTGGEPTSKLWEG